MSKELKKVRRHLPVFQGILPIKRRYIPTEIIAGITLAALGIPEVMGYTKIAGTPIITGLYTLEPTPPLQRSWLLGLPALRPRIPHSTWLWQERWRSWPQSF